MHVSVIRRLTPSTADYVYFQTSGFSPKPDPVVDEVIRLTRLAARGPAIPEVAAALQQTLETTRARVAASLNACPDEIVLGENATVGVNIVANGIDWQPGDSVILTAHEHPGNRIPWYNFVKRYGLRLRFLDLHTDDDGLLADLERLLDPGVRLLSLSHVSRRNGRRLPARAITALAHDYGIPVLWDGAQSYGAVPVDVRALDCDFYTFSGHKYIMAPQGTGGCYIRRDRIEWLKASWIGSHSQKDFDFAGNLTLLDEAKRFEFGTRNLADQGGFGKALELWAEIGWPNVFSYIQSYTDRLKSALLTVPNIVLHTPLPYDQSSGIVTFSLPGFTSHALGASLLEHERILTSTLEYDTAMLRISTHVFNTDAEIDRLIAGLYRLQRAGPKAT